MKLDVKTKSGNYPIIIKSKIINQLIDYLDVSKRYIIITDDGIPKVYLERILEQLANTSIITFKQGEQSKNLTVYKTIIDELLDLSVTKNDCLIAVGGGVCGDLTGFVASTYLRGIDYIQIPTSLLSQVDSSVGGKTGLNHLGYKNIIGSFYPPKLVLIDPNTLKTLPERHFNNGIAEVIKCGLIGSSILLNLLKKNDMIEDIEKIIFLSLEIKKNIVEKDEFDLNERKYLNFGHTLGHAYESYYDYNKYLHGEAIGLGMIPMIFNQSLKKSVLDLLHKYKLPTEDFLDTKELAHYILKDKKRESDSITLIIIEEIGKPRLKNIKIENIVDIL